jgi:hypothetical protein
VPRVERFYQFKYCYIGDCVIPVVILSEVLVLFPIFSTSRSHADTREIPSILWNRNIRYRFHWSIFWARSIQFIPSHPIFLRSVLILFSNLHLGFSSGVFPSGLYMTILYEFLVFTLLYFTLSWSLYSYLAKSTSYESPHYVVLSNFLPLYSQDNLFLHIYISYVALYGGFCGLVVRVPGYRSRGPGSFPGATTFSEK